VYRDWLRHRPDDHLARLAAVRLLADMGRRDMATELAREGVRHSPRNGENHLILGMALHDEGRPRAGLAEFELSYALFRGKPADRGRVRRLVLTMEKTAPVSRRGIYAGPPWHPAQPDSSTETTGDDRR